MRRQTARPSSLAPEHADSLTSVTCLDLGCQVTDNDEEMAFWLLVGMCDQFHLDGMWADGMPRLKLCFHVLDRLIEMRMPSLYQHFQVLRTHTSGGPHPTLIFPRIQTTHTWRIPSKLALLPQPNVPHTNSYLRYH